MLVLPATPALAHAIGTVAVLARRFGCLGHQLGNASVVAEQIPGPRQLLQPLQFKSPLHELRGENRIALWNFLCATTAAEVFGIMFEH
jgi:hypothetical protein